RSFVRRSGSVFFVLCPTGSVCPTSRSFGMIRSMGRVHEVVRGEGDLEQLAGIYAWPDADEPWIRAEFVTSIDGRTRGGDGLSGSINTEADHRVFDLLRATCDAVVAGRGTVEAEGYRPIELSEEQQGIRASAGLSGTPPLVIPGVGPLPPLLRAGLSAGSV